MKFKKTLTSKSTIKKQKEYSFDEDFSKQEFETMLKATFEKPFMKIGKMNEVFVCYMDKDNKLCIRYHHSFDKFTEIRK